ncbi:hypothetical protein JKF63_03860 [Porcisia hertigi]|uniref:Uncharacterized protein n=1 Tax=Porcisia hertigi TaxID=2761500 RepID=A0A836I6G4_9TRYP|nr:hypothetical protein JKF63_03860 [Porcisia hertigi]
MKPSKRSANLHGSQHIAKAPITENLYTTAADVKGRNDVQLEDGSDSCHKNSGAGAAVDAVVGEAHAGQTNGENFVVGDWYEGIVKRYNPLRGFGFLTCTHRLHFDLHACERACTRDADAVYAKQQECEVVNSVTAVISGMRATSKSANEDGVEQGTQKLQELESSSNNSKAQHTDDTSTTPLMTSKQPVKETDTHCPPAAVSTTHAGNVHDSDAGDAAAPPPPPPEVPLTSKAHRTVVYSTMQRYLSLIDTAGKERLPRDAGDEYTSRAPAKELGKLEREPAQLGDIFVHHSCISMSGFRVFAHGTAVRFSVAVLKETVQAVDVVQLGLESVESLSVKALPQPPPYKVTPAAATVLRYHRLEAERDNREYRVGDGKPQSCVGSTSVQWTDMAVIPSPAIPNSLEGQSELRVVHVPPPPGTMSHETTAVVTGERRNHGDGKDYGVKAQTANATDPASATTSTSAAAEAHGVPECLKTPTDISSVKDPDHKASLVVVVASQQQKNCHNPEEEHRRDGAKDPTTKLNSGGREHGTCVKRVLQQKTSEDSNSFCGGDLTSSRSDQTSGAGDSRFTGAQTSSCGSRNKTTTTTTDLMQCMYEDTDKLNLVLQHCLEHRKEIPRDVKCTTSHGSSGGRAETVLTHCMHEKTSSSSQSAGAGHGDEKNQLKNSEAAPLAAGSTATAPARTCAATAGDGIAPAPANVEFSASQTNDDTDSPAEHVCQGGSGSGDGSDEEKAPTTTTTAPTTPFGNTMPGCNRGPAPDWTDLFDLKMATEREKDIVMHKTDFKLLPHQSSRAAAVTAAPNHQKSGAVVNVCALVLNMVSFTSGAELDSTSSPGIAENEDVQDGDSRPAQRLPRRGLGESNKYEMNPSSSPQQLTNSNHNGETDTRPQSPPEAHRQCNHAHPL